MPLAPCWAASHFLPRPPSPSRHSGCKHFFPSEESSTGPSFLSSIAHGPTSKQGTKVGPRASPQSKKQPTCPSVMGRRGSVGQGVPTPIPSPAPWPHTQFQVTRILPASMPSSRLPCWRRRDLAEVWPCDLPLSPQVPGRPMTTRSVVGTLGIGAGRPAAWRMLRAGAACGGLWPSESPPRPEPPPVPASHPGLTGPWPPGHPQRDMWRLLHPRGSWAWRPACSSRPPAFHHQDPGPLRRGWTPPSSSETLWNDPTVS